MTTENDVTAPPERVYTIEELAQQVINDAMQTDVDPDLRVDAFKAVTTYHLGITKLKGKKSDEDDNVTTFESIKNRIKDAG